MPARFLPPRLSFFKDDTPDEKPTNTSGINNKNPIFTAISESVSNMDIMYTLSPKSNVVASPIKRAAK